METVNAYVCLCDTAGDTGSAFQTGKRATDEEVTHTHTHTHTKDFRPGKKEKKRDNIFRPEDDKDTGE